MTAVTRRWALSGLLALGSGSVRAGEWPEKSITWIVPGENELASAVTPFATREGKPN